jgi:hypothetical protein
VSVIDVLITPRQPDHNRRLNATPVESLTSWYQ